MTTTLPGSTTVITTPSDVEVEMKRSFHAPRTLVWDAFTRPEHLRQWMLGPDGWALTVCDMDLRPGGAWTYVWRRGDETEMAMQGEFVEVAPPERLVHTERWGGDWPETVNTLVLTEQDGWTTMSHRMRFPDRAARDAAMQSGMPDGADASYARLETLLQSLQ